MAARTNRSASGKVSANPKMFPDGHMLRHRGVEWVPADFCDVFATTDIRFWKRGVWGQTIPSSLNSQLHDRDIVAGTLIGVAALSALAGAALVLWPETKHVSVIVLPSGGALVACGGANARVSIVGVDEADPAAGLVAFVAPLARALLGHRVSDVVTVRAPGGEDRLEILSVDYDRE
jgi:hypothetical protein